MADCVLASAYGALEASHFDTAVIRQYEAQRLLEDDILRNFPSNMPFVNQIYRDNQLPGPLVTWGSDAENHAAQIKRSFILLAVLMNAKSRRRVSVLQLFPTDPDAPVSPQLQFCFYMVWFLLLNKRGFNLTTREQTILLEWLIHMYQSFEHAQVRRLCMSTCGIASWLSLSDAHVAALLERRPETAKFARVVQKRLRKTKAKYPSGYTLDSDLSTMALGDVYFLIDIYGFTTLVQDFMATVQTDLENRVDDAQLYEREVQQTSEPSVVDIFFGRTDAFFRVDLRHRAGSSFQQTDLAWDDLLYCERCIEFLIDLLSALPTRRFILPVYAVHHVVPRMKLSKVYCHCEGALIRQLLVLLEDYEKFPIDEASGDALSSALVEEAFYRRMQGLQMTCFQNFQDSTQEFYLKPVYRLTNPCEFERTLARFTLLQLFILLSKLHPAFDMVARRYRHEAADRVVQILCEAAGQTPGGVWDYFDRSPGSVSELDGRVLSQCAEEYRKTHLLCRKLLLHEVSLHKNPRKALKTLPLYPTELLIWNETIIPNASAQHVDCSLPLLKLNIQFLTLDDYLYRNFYLYRLEAAYELRETIQEIVQEVQPITELSGNVDVQKAMFQAHQLLSTESHRTDVLFRGSSSMAAPIHHFSIVHVQEPSITETTPDQAVAVPAGVMGELCLDMKYVPKKYHEEWNGLRQFDLLHLVAFDLGRLSQITTSETSENSFLEQYGIIGIRGCEIVEVLDEEGTSIQAEESQMAQELSAEGRVLSIKEPFGSMRTYRVIMDENQYVEDLQSSFDIYDGFQLAVRRHPNENNYKAVLRTIRDLIYADVELILPTWFHDLLLGYGHPNEAQYFNLPTELSRINFCDTFLDVDHIRQSFPNVKKISFEADRAPLPLSESQVFVEFPPQTVQDAPHATVLHPAEETMTIQTRPLVNRGPYKECRPLRNQIRFTPYQVEAIRSGVNEGLTLIVGPPGTGKTDTAVQIASLLNCNFPDQRIVMLAHSNQALNELFSKVAKLDVDERYLLRLGMGEKELRLSSDRMYEVADAKDFSKWGRINHMLQIRLDLLVKVDALAKSLRIPGDHGSSCETSGQFYEHYILSRIARFRDQLASIGSEGQNLRVTLRDMRAMDGIKGNYVNSEGILAQIQPVPKKTKPKKDPQPDGSSDHDNDVDMEEDAQLVEETPPLQDDLMTIEQADDEACVAVREHRKSPVQVLFPFSGFFSDTPEPLFPADRLDSHAEIAEGCFRYLHNLFQILRECRPFELLRTHHDRATYLLTCHAKIVAMTCTHAALTRHQLIQMKFKYDTLIVEEAAQLLEIEGFIPLVLQQPNYNRESPPSAAHPLTRPEPPETHHLHRGSPSVASRGQKLGETKIPLSQEKPSYDLSCRCFQYYQQHARLDQSMFARFVRLKVPFIQLDAQGRCRTAIRNLFSWRYQNPPLGDLDNVRENAIFHQANPGLAYTHQFVNVEDYQGKGEFCTAPHQFQNRGTGCAMGVSLDCAGEAEFVIGFYMYLRLLGYPRRRIAILTSYNGQKALLREVIQKRCGWNPAIGWPGTVSTVDKFQGQQADYVLLSLVRTKAVGHMRDVRRLVVAVSRARLGLYIFGRYSLFAKMCTEAKPTFELLEKLPKELGLVRSEMTMDTTRQASDPVPVHLISWIKDPSQMFQAVQSFTQQLLVSQIPPPPEN